LSRRTRQASSGLEGLAQGAAVAGTRQLLSEFESILREPGCPICHQAAEAERNFFCWFEIESFSTAETQSRLRAAMGMCPAHSRRLIQTVGAENVLNIAAREAVAGARQILGSELQADRCPVCEAVAFTSERACAVLLRALNDGVNQRLYREREGICLVHLARIAQTAEISTLAVLAEHLLDALSKGDAQSTLRLLAGSDHDAPLRARWRERLPHESVAGSTVEQLTARVKIGACPACLSIGTAKRDYLQWFVERAQEDDPSLQSDPGEFCPAHLHDLASLNGAGATLAIERKRTTRMRELRDMRERLVERRATARRGRRIRSDGPGGAAEELLSAHHCAACHAVESVGRSQLDLVTAALAVAPVRERYERSHGLCVRHVTAINGAQSADLVKRHLDARLGVLAWEVQETARKYAFAYRHEPTGPEQGAWLRALAQVDGRVFEGAPAVLTDAEDC
jgi:hypothetical protein